MLLFLLGEGINYTILFANNPPQPKRSQAYLKYGTQLETKRINFQSSLTTLSEDKAIEKCSAAGRTSSDSGRTEEGKAGEVPFASTSAALLLPIHDPPPNKTNH
jgi:hypothetical protein